MELRTVEITIACNTPHGDRYPGARLTLPDYEAERLVRYRQVARYVDELPPPPEKVEEISATVSIDGEDRPMRMGKQDRMLKKASHG